MTTIDPQASAASQHDAPPPCHPCPCRDESAPLVIRPEWIPLDEIAQAWATFSLCASHTHALQAVGTAFLALSWETSAHTHYTQASHGLWKSAPCVVAQGIAQAILDLKEASQQWASAFLWLERFANEVCHDEERLPIIRTLFEGIHEQQQRVWLLLVHLQEEQRRRQDQPLVVHLGHLSSPLAAAAEEERRACP